MKHLQGFNEKFNFGKLNIFSKKEKEEITERDYDDDELANKIFKKIAPGSDLGFNDLKCEVTGNCDDRGGILKCDFEGDKFVSTPGAIKINGSKLDCKPSITKKFYNQFVSAKKRQDKESERAKDKEAKDKLKDKYNK